MSEHGAQLLEELMRFRPEDLTANAWAVKAGVSRTIWADLRRHGNPSRRTLSKLLEAAGSSLAEFEALRIGNEEKPAALKLSDRVGDARMKAWPAVPLPPVPLLELGPAGEWGESGLGIELHWIDRSRTIGKVDRPTSLAADAGAYAVSVVGESMWPRFRSGRRLLVSPAARVSAGDDVLVQLAGDKVLIKELVGRSAMLLELRQFHPDTKFQVPANDAAALHKIVGEAI